MGPVFGDKLPLPPRPVKSMFVAVHAVFVALLCTPATGVLNVSTTAAVGHLWPLKAMLTISARHWNLIRWSHSWPTSASAGSRWTNDRQNWSTMTAVRN